MTSVEKLNERVWNLQPLLVDDGDGFQPNYLQTPAKMLEGWQLTAYGLDELALRQGKPNVPVVFRGQAAESGNAQGQWDGWSWSLDGMDFVITGTTPSLIWNSGFELPIANALIPSGFRDLAGDPKNPEVFYTQHFFLRQEERNGWRSKTLTLSTGQESLVTVITTIEIPTTSEFCFLGGAWVKGSSGRLGLFWYSKAGRFLGTSNIVRSTESQEWMHVSGIVCSPDAPDGAAVALPFIRVVNPGSETHFDDVFLFLLPKLPAISELLWNH
jgi:hypothetical protein